MVNYIDFWVDENENGNSNKFCTFGRWRWTENSRSYWICVTIHNLVKSEFMSKSLHKALCSRVKSHFSLLELANWLDKISKFKKPDNGMMWNEKEMNMHRHRYNNAQINSVQCALIWILFFNSPFSIFYKIELFSFFFLSSSLHSSSKSYLKWYVLCSTSCFYIALWWTDLWWCLKHV